MTPFGQDVLTATVTPAKARGAPSSGVPLSCLVFNLHLADLKVRTLPQHSLARNVRSATLRSLERRADAQAWIHAAKVLGEAPLLGPGKSPATLSLQQQAMAAASEGARPIPLSVELGASFNPVAFRRAIRAVVTRHPVLVAKPEAEADGQAVAFWDEDCFSTWLDERMGEARRLNPVMDTPGYRALLAATRQRPFEFEVLRHGLGYRAHFSFHPLVFDQVSAPLFHKAFRKAYQGGHFAIDAAGGIHPNQAPLTFFDYAAWQRTTFTPALLKALDAYWAAWITTAAVLAHPRSGQPLVASGQGSVRRLPLPTPIGSQLRDQAIKLRVDPSDLLVAVVARGILDWSGSSQLTVLRRADLRSPRLKDAIGPLSGLDPLVVRAAPGQRAAEFARQVMAEGLLSKQMRRPDDGTDWPASPSRLRDLAPVLVSSRCLTTPTSDEPADMPRKTLGPVEIEHIEGPAGDEIRLRVACASISAADRDALGDALTRAMSALTPPAPSASPFPRTP